MKDITVKDLCKSYGKNRVLDGFSYTFKAGGVTCIAGESGRGKTTLLEIIAGIREPDSGELAGVPERISFVFQENRLSENFSAVSNIRLVCGKEKSKEEIASHLNELGLDGGSAAPVSSYSGGMKRRVAIARAICFDADLIILDEPFNGLDPGIKKKTMDYVLEHTKGKTVIAVTHDMAEAEYMGGSLLKM